MEKLSRADLIAKAEALGLKGVKSKTKAVLLAAIAAAPAVDQTPIPAPPLTHAADLSQSTFIEVCAGCGGLSTGFMNVGFHPLLLNELIAPFTLKSQDLNTSSAQPLWLQTHCAELPSSA